MKITNMQMFARYDMAKPDIENVRVLKLGDQAYGRSRD
jgi:hypothetical protein